MTIERNKRDFESALADLKREYKDLKDVLNDDILNNLKEVIDEYDGHFSGDIETLMERVEELEDEVEELKAKNVELEKTL